MDLLYTAHVPPGDGPFPTILALHGWGASAHDLIGLAPILNGGGALVLCPQGPLAFEIGQGFLGFGWFDLSQVRPPSAAAPEPLPQPALQPVALGRLTLADLEHQALAASPAVARAAAMVNAARGNWVQVGLPPNPTVGYEGQQIGSGGRAEQDGIFVEQEFVRGGNKNKLDAAHQQRILDAFTARADVPHFATLVGSEAIAANGYNLSVSSWVEAEDTREVVDITELNARIAGIVERQSVLREQIDAIVADLEGAS